mgnify:CR=1 FL=1
MRSGLRVTELEARSSPQAHEEGRIALAILMSRKTLRISTVDQLITIVIEPIVTQGIFLHRESTRTTRILGMVDATVAIIIKTVAAFRLRPSQLVHAPVRAQHEELTPTALPQGHRADISEFGIHESRAPIRKLMRIEIVTPEFATTLIHEEIISLPIGEDAPIHRTAGDTTPRADGGVLHSRPDEFGASTGITGSASVTTGPFNPIPGIIEPASSGP